IPTGLHVFGRPPARAVTSDALRMLASFERPELGVVSLPDVISTGLGFESYSVVLAGAASEQSLRSRETVDELARRVIDLFLECRGNEATEAPVRGQTEAQMRGRAGPVDRCVQVLEESSCAVDRSALEKLFAFLDSALAGMESSEELDSLAAALRG